MATPPAASAADTLNLDKCISAARRMNSQPAKNTSLPFSSINLTRPATEQSLPATCPSLRAPPRQPPTSTPLRSISENTAPPYCSRTNAMKEKGNGKIHKVHEIEFTLLSWSGCQWPRRKGRQEKVKDSRNHEKWPVNKKEVLLTLLHAG